MLQSGGKQVPIQTIKMNQQEANNLSNMQSQITQMGQQVQQIEMMSNGLTAGRTTFQNR